MKKAWNLLTLNGEVIHPQVLSDEKIKESNREKYYIENKKTENLIEKNDTVLGVGKEEDTVKKYGCWHTCRMSILFQERESVHICCSPIPMMVPGQSRWL